MSQIRSDFFGPGWVLLVLVAAACGEPTQPGTVASKTTAPDELAATPSRLAAMLAAMADETARLRPAFGEGFAEAPLRLALNVLQDHVVADQAADVSRAVGEARSLLEGYRLSSGGSPEGYQLSSASSDSLVADTSSEEGIDVSELDALDLLLMAINEAMAADSSASLDTAAIQAINENGGSS